MRRTTDIKLDQAITRSEEFISRLEEMDDKKLSKYLDLFRQQMEIAQMQQNETAYRLLAEYERQTITARLRRNFGEE